jgi:8-oxo-dGTP pyrophosphatase MutT (NUDIX family)
MQKFSPWKLLSSRTTYKNAWLAVREDSVITPTGSQGVYGVIESNDSVAVAALNDKNELYIHRIFRYPLQNWQWEVPGGGGDKEHAIQASKRELEEETGLKAEQWDILGVTGVCNGFMTEKMTTCLARGLSVVGDKEVSDEQTADGGFYSLEKIGAMIDSGEIQDGQTMTVLYLLQRWLEKNS